MRFLHIQLFVFPSLFLLFSCASQHVYLERAVIRNETGNVISEVRIRHEPTGKIGEVHSILPHSQLEVGFAEQQMRASRAIITWRTRDGQQKNAELELPGATTNTVQASSSVLFYTIYPDGSVTAKLK